MTLMKVDFFKHNIDGSDIERVNDVLRSLFLTTGEEVDCFETKFANYVGIQYIIAVTSCTAALHLCLVAWGIGKGDEVITTPMSFCATSNAVLHAGATPVFVDVEEDTGNINAELIESKITERTKAILPVHLYGQMCNMEKIRQIADKYKLVVIEDAAHCIEGIRNGIRPGRLGDAACFSFYATKSITSGEGGAVATKDSTKAELLRKLRLHGMDKSASDRYTKKYKHWDMPVLGWKYNMDNIQAALLIGQLDRIEELRNKRDRICKRYEEAFSAIKKIRLMKTYPGSKHARHLFPILVPGSKRDAVLDSLQKKGIGVAVNYRPIHLLSFYRQSFRYKEGDFPVAEYIGSSTISLPLYPLLTDKEMNYVIKTVREITQQL